jgi:hypothetical protein
MSIRFCLDCGEKTVQRKLALWNSGGAVETVDMCPECGRIYRPGRTHEPLPGFFDTWDDDERPNLEIDP